MISLKQHGVKETREREREGIVKEPKEQHHLIQMSYTGFHRRFSPRLRLVTFS